MQVRNALLVGIFSLCGLVLQTSGARINTRAKLPRGVPPSHTIHERHEETHVEGWIKRELADANWVLPVRIGLKQSNVDAGHELLMDISNPRSANYGRHLTRSEVVELFAPQNDSVAEVKQWLASAGIHARRVTQSANQQWMQFDAPVHEAEKLLHARYHVFEHLETGSQNIACSQYHVPHNVSHHIDYITPGIKLMASGHGTLSKRFLTGDLPDKGAKSQGQSNYCKGKWWCWPSPPPSPPAPPPPRPSATPSWPSNDNPYLVTGLCSEEVTPQCLRAQYHIPNGTKAARGNQVGIFQSLSQHYSQQDLDAYWKYIAPWVPQGTHPDLRSINGALGPANDSSVAGDEADLDFEVAMPLIWPQRAVLFQTDDEWYQQNQQLASSPYPGFFNTFFDALDESYCHLSAFNLTGDCTSASCRDPQYPDPNATAAQGGYQGTAMCGRYSPTSVLSLSYSGAEASWPANYMRRQCLEIMKLALQGVTVVESSGDFGVGGTRTDSQAGCLGANRNVYAPRVMGNCPYVLSVGATTLVEPEAQAVPSATAVATASSSTSSSKGKGGGGIGSGQQQQEVLVEVAAESFASGGGFSNVFARPSWQDTHVQGYLDKANVSDLGYVWGSGGFESAPPLPSLNPGKLFNKAGRGYPDVAAVGENYRVALRGNPNRMHGTSVATPIWAAILTLINEERLAAGKSTVGFVHQVLYEHPEVFTDITTGSNPGCGSGGFQVKEGWDPVTGLGSPIYPKLLELFMSLP